jgi:basic amino acid/polyamine antiporter, APA family
MAGNPPGPVLCSAVSRRMGVGERMAEVARAAAPPGNAGLVRGLGLLDATTLLVGSVIGSGIFVAPSIMAGYLETPGLLLGLWIVGGMLTLFGALAYAELAAAMPKAGGPYVFLSEAFSPVWGFLYGWTLLLAINTGFIAAVAVAFAKYLGVFFPAVGEAKALFTLAGGTFSTAQAVALAVIAILTVLNITGLRTGAFVQNLFTFLKVGAVVVLIAVAVVTAKGSLSNFLPLLEVRLGPKALEMGLFAAMGAAMSKALFAYDAWNSVAFAAEEVRDPERNLPRSLFLGTLVITAVYCGAVAAYIYVVPVAEMARVTDNRIAAEAAERLLGRPGEAFIAVAIMISGFGCVNGLILSGARVVYAMARDRLFFPGMATIHPTFRTPANALVLQGVIAAGLTLTGTYSDLLTLSAFSSLLFNTLTILGLFVLRRTRPDLPRPYRTWGYPVLPLVYILVSVFFLYYIFKGEPTYSGLGLGLTLLGVPAYVYWKGRSA